MHILIRLDTPKEWPDQALFDFPVATHVKMVNVSFEYSRPRQEKIGWVDTWFAPGIIASDGDFLELPGMEGLNIRVEEPVFPEVAPIAGSLQDNVAYLLSHFAIMQGAVQGTVIVV